MWILAKHPVAEGSDDVQYYLLGGRTYVIGRKNCDIIIPGDISISRKHARISVQKMDANDTGRQPIETLTIMDTSKVGVLVNGRKISPNVDEVLKDGDLISFGAQHLKYKLIYQKLIVVTSCINISSAKAAVKSCLEKLGGVALQNWSEQATHLVMEKVTFTIKVVCAIACGRPVVSVKYLEDLLDCSDKKTGLTLPNYKDYLPPISEQTLIGHELLFQPSDNRRTLMAGKLFIVLVSTQLNRIKDAIQFAGGQIVLKDTQDVKLVSHISSNQAIVLQVEKKDEKNISPSQMKWIKEIYVKLKMQKLRPIRESEIGLSILHVSLEKYCNPTLKAAPAISGSSHTQVMQESLSVSQVLAENTCAFQGLDETQDIRGNHSVSVALIESTANTPKRLPSVENPNAEADVIGTKRKRPISLENTCDNEQKKINDFFKKPKLKQGNNACSITDNTVCMTYCEENEDKSLIPPHNDLKTKEQKNFISIDDEDDDDVFSFNFSRPVATKTSDKDCSETIASTIQNHGESSTVKDREHSVPLASGQSFMPTAHELNSQSDVLFTSLSKKASADSCQPSLNPPLSGKLAPDTCLPSAVAPLDANPGCNTKLEKSCVPESCPSFLLKKVSDDDDDDDDPFSFSVRTSAPVLSKLKVKSNKDQKNVTEDYDKMNSDTEGLIESDTLGSDSDSSARRAKDDPKQTSRYIKAVSSSQCSEAESVLVSDGEGNLVTKESTSEKTEANDVDMSYMLNDDYDDELEVASKEYSLQKQNHIIPKGFMSTLDKRPKVSVIKEEEEDPDLIGIDTKNLVQKTFASLVVKQKQKGPRKTSDIPGSKLKNYKTFKKQCYAGANSEIRRYHAQNFVVYESDNIERANLFADIREKDEEEAEENRRIDKMFDVMPHSRKR